jgi:CheY-like chemotaxis protein
MLKKHESDETHVFFYTTDRKDDELLIHTLQDSKLKVKVSNSKLALVECLKQEFGKIILISQEDINDSLSLYYQCLALVPDHQLYDHALLVTCSRQDEQQAFDYFLSRAIDDYLLSRPLYEVHRPVTVCYQQLEKLGIYLNHSVPLPQIQTGQSLPEDKEELLKVGVERKNRLKLEFDTLLKEFDKTISDTEASLQQNKLDDDLLLHLHEQLSGLKHNNFRPRLIRLQHSALDLLNALLLKFAPEKPADAPEEIDTDEETLSETLPQQVDSPSAEDKHDDEPRKAAKVLLVEDDNVSAMMSSKLLKNLGFDVHWTSLGRRALAYLQTNQYSLILMDINLPDTDGLMVADQLSHMQCINSNTPVAILTGNKHKNLVERAAKSGAKHYIVKPLHIDTMIKLCQKYQIEVE